MAPHGATYEADEALSRGWVDEIMEADALMANVMAAAQRRKEPICS